MDYDYKWLKRGMDGYDHIGDEMGFSLETLEERLKFCKSYKPINPLQKKLKAIHIDVITEAIKKKKAAEALS